MSNVRIGGAVSASFGFISTAWSKAAGILAANLLAITAFQIVAGIPGLAVPAGLLRIVVFLVLGTMLIGALYRIGLAPDHPGDAAYALGPGGFQWGALESRVLGANLLIGAICAVIALVLFLVWGVGLGLTVGGRADLLQRLQAGSDADRMAALGQMLLGPAGLVTAAIFIPVGVALIYLGARLSLFALHAGDTGSFSFGQAWRLTRGAVLALLVGGLVIFLIEIVIGGVSGGIAGLLAGMTGRAGAGSLWGSRVSEVVDAATNAPKPRWQRRLLETFSSSTARRGRGTDRRNRSGEGSQSRRYSVV
jgi:hypothetical protein